MPTSEGRLTGASKIRVAFKSLRGTGLNHGNTTDPGARSKSKIPHIVIAVLLLAGIGGFIFAHRNELVTLADAMRAGRWYWLLIAAVCEALYYACEAVCFSRALGLTGTRISTLSVLPVLLSAQALSVVAPSEFLADQSAFFFIAKRYGKSPALMALGVSLAEMAELLSFMVVMIIGLLFLIIYHSLRPFELAAAGIASAICLGMVAAIAFLLWKQQDIANILTTIEGFWNRFCRMTRHFRPLPQEWAGEMSRRLMEGIKIAREDPRRLVVLLLIALAEHIIRIACLFAVFQAFAVSIALWKITSAYAIGTLVWILSPIPGGIGLVEGTYSLVFHSLGIRAAPAATLALVYRGMTFWLPLGAGIIALRLLSRHGAVE
jgi:hypothetical protein